MTYVNNDPSKDMSKLNRLGETFLLMVTSLNLRVPSERWKNKHLHSLLFREIYIILYIYIEIYCFHANQSTSMHLKDGA